MDISSHVETVVSLGWKGNEKQYMYFDFELRKIGSLDEQQLL